MKQEKNLSEKEKNNQENIKIVLKLDKNINENTALYFEEAKKLKKKIITIKEVINEYENKLKELDSSHNQKEDKHQKDIKKTTKNKENKWFDKFRWFISSNFFLVIAGRDATTNEIIIKKYTDKNDLVFHTELSGSPFAIIKSENNKIDEKTIEEAAKFTATYSKAWELGLMYVDVFYVNPEQVSKETESGEYMSKGSFMIRGKKNYIKSELELYIGKIDYNKIDKYIEDKTNKQKIKELFNNEERIMAGPKSAVEKFCSSYIEIIRGKTKKSNVAKSISRFLEYDDLDEIIRMLPNDSKTGRIFRNTSLE